METVFQGVTPVPSGPNFSGPDAMNLIGELTPFTGNQITVVPPEMATNNTYISTTYTPFPHSDGSHLSMGSYMPVFINKQTPDRKYRAMVYMMTLGNLNVHCRVNWDSFQLHSKNEPDNVYRRPDAVTFANYLRLYGEHQLFIVDRAIKNGIPVQDEALRKFHEMAIRDEFRWITLFGLLRYWAFAGVIISTGASGGESELAITQYSRAKNKLWNVAVITGGKAEVGNVWGDTGQLRVGSKLYFVWRRARLPNGRVGPYEVVPYGSSARDWPPQSEFTWEDAEGRTQRGHCEQVGVITEAIGRTAESARRQQAAGLSGVGDYKVADDAYKSLPTIWIAVKI